LCITVLIAGGVQSLIWALWKSRLTDVLHNTLQALRHSAMRLAHGEIPGAQDFPVGQEPMPYALAIGVGAMAYVIWKSAF
jgi:Flp pilus assembly protein protease CpaA